jgi:CheY-like chemotaxis protein
MAMPSSSSRRTGNPVSDVVELEVELLEPRGTATAPDGEVPLRPDVPAFAILVVDDDPDLRRYVRRSLKRPGHPETQVVEAGDGPEALRIVADAPLDLVITDVVMPGMDGFNLVQAIRRSHSADRLPVLVMTGEGSWREAESEAARVGAQAVLSKPFNAHKLCDVVARLLGARAPPTPTSNTEAQPPEDPF